MATINPVDIGSAADAGDGDPLRTAFDKLNDNDDAINDELATINNELATKLSLPVGDVVYPGNNDYTVAGTNRIEAVEYGTALTAPRTLTLGGVSEAVQQGDLVYIYRTASGDTLTVTGLYSGGSGTRTLNNVGSFLIAVYDGSSNHWRVLAWQDGAAGGGGDDDQTASEVPFTPAGTLAATDVQAALEELDTEKAAISSLATVATSGEFADLLNIPAPVDDVVYPGDADHTVNGQVRKVGVEYGTPLTAPRTVTLQSSGAAQVGDIAFIYRAGAATGSSLTVTGLYAAGTATKSLNTPDSFLIAVYDGPTNKWRVLAWRDQVATDRIAADAVDNTRLSNMPAWSLKARNTGSTGDPEDVDLAELAEEASPTGGHKLMGFLGTGELRTFDVANLPTAGGGEVNTGSNVGTDGVGVFNQKTGINLEFRHVAPASNKVSVALNGQDIDLDVNDANLSVTSAQVSDLAAAQVPVTPAGDIVATDVQAALEELDTDKAAATSVLVPTAVKTTAYTAAIGDLVVTDSSVAPFNVTAPASPTHGQMFGVFDDTDSWSTNPVTLLQNGNTFEGVADDILLDGGKQAVLVFNATANTWRFVFVGEGAAGGGGGGGGPFDDVLINGQLTLAGGLKLNGGTVSGLLTMADHSGKQFTTSGDCTIPNEADFTVTLRAGGAHNIDAGGAAIQLSTGDWLTVVVWAVNEIEYVQQLAASVGTLATS